ncbi:MAG: translation initiation factor IF-2 N-terminal domain-containing protein, partial [Dehalococcoidia bacterium]|nr:translation initiation factor IF-2 N-terminal domain-containing protein [Dehalococcoidia bacterium]
MVEVERQEVEETSMPELELPRSMTVRDMAGFLKATPVDVIKQLMRQGLMANINQVVDYEVAAKVANALGYMARLQSQETRKASVIAEIKKQQSQMTDEAGNLKFRP